jgi:hypothetical protein
MSANGVDTRSPAEVTQVVASQTGSAGLSAAEAARRLAHQGRVLEQLVRFFPG